MIQKKKQIKKYRNIDHQKDGFTLIELAVVMSVLAILLVVIVFAINASKMKSQDSLRLSHVKSIGIIIDNEDIQSPSSDIIGCAQPHSLIQSCTGPRRILDIKNYKDPKIGASNSCSGGDAAPKAMCGYSISNSAGQGNPKTNDYEICFYLEKGTKDFPRGIYSVKAGGAIKAGCE